MRGKGSVLMPMQQCLVLLGVTQNIQNLHTGLAAVTQDLLLSEWKLEASWDFLVHL